MALVRHCDRCAVEVGGWMVGDVVVPNDDGGTMRFYEENPATFRLFAQHPADLCFRCYVLTLSIWLAAAQSALVKQGRP